jgi:hypothetical protein
VETDTLTGANGGCMAVLTPVGLKMIPGPFQKKLLVAQPGPGVKVTAALKLPPWHIVV